jgi:hypothetical protein
LCCELAIGFGNSDDLQVRPLLKLVEKSERVSMHQSCQCDAQRRILFFRRGLRLCTQMNARAREED